MFLIISEFNKKSQSVSEFQKVVSEFSKKLRLGICIFVSMISYYKRKIANTVRYNQGILATGMIFLAIVIQYSS